MGVIRTRKLLFLNAHSKQGYFCFLPAAKPSGPRTVIVVFVVGGPVCQSMIYALCRHVLNFGFINSLRGGINNKQQESASSKWDPVWLVTFLKNSTIIDFFLHASKKFHRRRSLNKVCSCFIFPSCARIYYEIYQILQFPSWVRVSFCFFPGCTGSASPLLSSSTGPSPPPWRTSGPG